MPTATASRPHPQQPTETTLLEQHPSNRNDMRDIVSQHHQPESVGDKLLPLDTPPLTATPAASSSSSASSSTSSSSIVKQQQHEQLVLAIAATTHTDSDAVALPTQPAPRTCDRDDSDRAMRCEGYLRKRYSTSMYMGSWRYCIADGTRLRWYMSAELAATDEQLRGEVWVKAIEPWSGHGTMNTYVHAFAIRTLQNHVLLCSAKTRADKDTWVASLTQSLERHHRSQPLPKRIDSTAPYAAPPDAPPVDRNSRSSSSHQYAGTGTAGLSERRRIVPEDMVRHPLFESQQLPASDCACAQCAIRFRSVRTRRVVCASCARAFCARHCAHLTILTHLQLQTARRCCLTCAQRQRFIESLTALTTFVIRVSDRFPHMDAALRDAQPRVCDPTTAVLLTRTLQKLQTAPMSLIKTIKILYQTRRKPLLFRAACERLPFYVEHCVDRVENLWFQILHLFQCCDVDHATDSRSDDAWGIQLFYLRRFIRAICRRSPRIALQTIWHVQASIGDANGLHPHALLALLGFIYPSLSSSSSSEETDTETTSAAAWKQLLLAQCPDHQRDAIFERLNSANMQTERLIAREPETPITRWLNATTVSAFEASADELAASGIELCAFQSSILYDSLRINDDDDRSTASDWLGPRGFSRASDAVAAHVSRPSPLDALVFDQVNFVQSLAAISERLRFVQPVTQRSACLAHELTLLNATLPATALYPLCTASDELYRVVRVPPTEGKVFTTKMRAPTMIYLEVVPVAAAAVVDSTDTATQRDATDEREDDVIDDSDRLRPFLCMSQPRGSTFFEALSAQVVLGDNCSSRDSLVSSTESATTTTDVMSDASALAVAHTPAAIAVDSDANRQLDDAADADDDVMRASRRYPSDPPLYCDVVPTPPSLPPSAAIRTNSSNSGSAIVDTVIAGAPHVFGERWRDCSARIQRASPVGHLRGWQLFSAIIKTNDDLRQEVFTMQLLQKFQSIFHYETPTLCLRTYRIVATGASIGLVETITDASSLDYVKKHVPHGDVAAFFTHAFGPTDSHTFVDAQQRFIASMAAYSVVCYVLLVKDRHNGNILLSATGEIVHIDFGFVLGIAPGGRFSLEDAPFKLTTEMVAIMGGIDSEGFLEYRRLMIDGLVALQKYHSEIAALVQTTGQHSPFPCFAGAKLVNVVAALRDRLCVGLSREQIAKRVDQLLRKSFNVWGTRQYDAFQLRSNNIHP